MKNELSRWSEDVRRLSMSDVKSFEDAGLIEKRVTQIERSTQSMRVQVQDVLARGNELRTQIDQMGKD